MIYFDNNSTTPLDKGIIEKLIPFLESQYGNASSRHHSLGWGADEAVKQARIKVANLINVDDQQVFFTSGATESINLVMKGVFESYQAKGKHIITVKTEHTAMLDTCEFLATKGAEITYLNVDSKGFIDLDELRDSIRKDTILISVMAVNNETGVIQPVEEIAQIAQKNNIFFLSDITQAIGKMPLDINKLGIDFVVWSAHKIYGMKGVGAVYIRRKSPRIKLMPLIHGGGHERGIRSGTLNVPAIFAFGEASEIALKNLEKDRIRVGELRDFLEKELLEIPNTTMNGDTTKRLYNVTNIRFEGIDSEALLMGINFQICASNGSACTSASMNPSHVLMAMGLSEDESFSSIRFSLGRYNTIEEVEESAKFISDVVKKLRSFSTY